MRGKRAAPPGAWFPQGIRPPFSFVLTKENAPRPVEEKTAGCQTLRILRKVWQIRGSCESACP